MAPGLRSEMAVRILVSNDDGIYSPGIALLAEVASEFGSVQVVAPDGEYRRPDTPSRTRGRCLTAKQM
jgi:broad specificity polyphosphatase/5'/3'-nucleotidase SurE